MTVKEKVIQVLGYNPGGLSPTIIGMNIGFDYNNASSSVSAALKKLKEEGKVLRIKEYGGSIIYKLNPDAQTKSKT
jgi:DNA-binding transcriptional ArsR family regulator